MLFILKWVKVRFFTALQRKLNRIWTLVYWLKSYIFKAAIQTNTSLISYLLASSHSSAFMFCWNRSTILLLTCFFFTFIQLLQIPCRSLFVVMTRHHKHRRNQASLQMYRAPFDKAFGELSRQIYIKTSVAERIHDISCLPLCSKEGSEWDEGKSGGKL